MLSTLTKLSHSVPLNKKFFCDFDHFLLESADLHPSPSYHLGVWCWRNWSFCAQRFLCLRLRGGVEGWSTVTFWVLRMLQSTVHVQQPCVAHLDNGREMWLFSLAKVFWYYLQVSETHFWLLFQVPTWSSWPYPAFGFFPTVWVFSLWLL